MGKRHVKGIGAALARTNQPLPEIVPARTGGDGLENCIAGLGTERDKRSYTRYNMPQILTRYDLENMFRSSDVAKRIVTDPADQMTREWRKFQMEDEDNSNPMNDSLEEAEKKFNVKYVFRDAMYWARLYGASFIVLGMKDAVRTTDMLKPIKVENVKLGDLKYIQVIDRWRCAPSGKLTTDVTSPNFGLPETYIIAESSVEVHWTRIIRFNGQKLPYFSWRQNGLSDDSELQHTWDTVKDYDTARQSINSMLFEANIDVVSVEGLFNLLSTNVGEQKLIKRFQLSQMMKSFNRTLMLDSKETYEKKQNQFTNLDKILEQNMKAVCGASHIPMSILFGDQGNGMQSGGDDDLRNYYDWIALERAAKMEPQLNYFDQVFVRSVLGSIPKGFKSVWESLWQTDDADEAQIEYQRAQRDQIYLQAGVVNEGLVASELKKRGTYSTMTNEDVQLAEELGQKMDDFQDTQREQQVESTDVNIKNAKSGKQQAGQQKNPANKGKQKIGGKK